MPLDKRLLVPGWAGPLTLEEARYIQQELKKNPALRRKWRITGKTLAPIARRAFPEAPEDGVRILATEQSRECRQNHS